MKIFVWVDHGQVDVYAANTHKQLVGIANEIAVRCRSYLNYQQEIEDILKDIDESPMVVIYDLIELSGDDPELFMSGTGFKNVIDMEG